MHATARRLLFFLTLALSAIGERAAFGQSAADSLADGFRNPPEAAWPRTWWHWTRGHVTHEGITKDLEWMRRVGIRGFQLADVAAGGGQSIEAPLDFGSPEWLAAVQHAAAEAQRLGLEMAIFSSAGWSLTGGPWVEPQQAMKKLVWSATHVEGGREVRVDLPEPPSNNGPFRDVGADRPSRDPTHYGDSAVIAFPTPEHELQERAATPAITASDGLSEDDAERLVDDSYAGAVTVRPPSRGEPAWIQFEYAELIRAEAVTIAGPNGIPVGRVLASDDGQHWKQTPAVLPGAQLYRQGRVRTFAFPPVTARYFRIEFTGASLNPAATMNETAPQPAESYALWEARLHSGPRVHRWEEKAGFGFLFEYETVPTPPIAAEDCVPADAVIDLTDRMAADGTLTWEAPAGHWTILRMGYSLTGAKNRPATPAGLGYEVDKLSREHTTAYYEAYAGMLKEALGPLYGREGLTHMLLDSWEAGQQNWTENMLAEFQQRRGYDPRPFLPTLTGRVVGSGALSDRFLWDFRRTLADMFAENHYAVMDELLAADGLDTYSEAAGVSLEIPEDTLLNKSKVDIPMGEFWVRDLHPRLMYFQDVRGAASAAHVYGKPLVAAEAFTGGGYESPYRLKQVADYWLAQGINRLVFHTSAHQPLDTPPGNTMVGTHLHRNITWAEQAGPYMEYLARTCYMLQQGQFVADVAYLLDEGAPSTMPIWGAGTTPAPPAGYDYDFINADVLLNHADVDDDGCLRLASGMTYRVLVLPESRRIRPALLGKLRTLVDGGLTVVGPKPLASPSLSGGWDTEFDSDVKRPAAELWGDLDGASRTIRHVHEGRVVWGRPLEEVLGLLQGPPDFEYAAGLDAELAWIHRRTEDADIYYVANCTDQRRSAEARFRIAGREAEIWRPDAGTIEPASFEVTDDRTTVPLALGAHEAVFVVFRKPTAEASREERPKSWTTLATVDSAWEVTFPPEAGAPERIELSELQPWSDHEDQGVRFFSGTAEYSATLTAPAAWFGTDVRILLDLGDVRDVAEVRVNDEPAGIVWKPPYRVDVTALLHEGENRLTIAVTNQWTNRIAGDARVPEDQRVLNVPPSPFGRGRGEPPGSGLLGPVTVLRLRQASE